MEIAALILSSLSLLIALANLTWNLAKHFSSHKIQMVPMPTPGMPDPVEMGRNMLDQFRELGDPIEQEELERLKSLKKTKK